MINFLSIGLCTLLLSANVTAFSLNAVQKVTDAINANMHYLSLDEFPNMVRFPAKLTEFTSLEIMNANATKVADISLLKKLTALRYLSLNYTEVENIEPLTKLVELQRLDLKGTKIIDIGPLSGLSNLLTLS